MQKVHFQNKYTTVCTSCKQKPVLMLSYMQTGTITPNIVGPTMLGVVASVLAVVCKQMQHFPTMLGVQCIVGRIQPIRLWRPYVMGVHWPNNVERAVQTGIQHCCVTLRRSRNKWHVGSCWFKSLTGFKFCATTPNNKQQHATGCANGYNMQHPTMLEVAGQQCCIRLHGALCHYLS